MFLLIVTPTIDFIKNNSSPSILIKWITKIYEEYEHEKTIDVEWLHREGFEDINKTEFIMEDHLCYEVADGKILMISENDPTTMTVKDFLQRAEELSELLLRG